MSIIHKYRKQLSVILVFFLVLGCWTCYQIWRSYHQLTVNTFEIDGDVNGLIRIAVLADLHENTFGEENVKLVEMIKNTKPDLIFMDGDMLNEDSTSHDGVIDLIERLKPICPIYYSLGNHEDVYEESHPELWSEIEQAGAVYLEKEYVDIEVKGQQIRIGGLYEYAFALDGNNSMDPKLMNSELAAFLTDFVNTDSYKIMLAHRPDSFIFASEPDFWDIDLVVSGHIHGGQVVVPFMGGLWAPDQGYFPEYTHGMYELGDITMAITSGLGSHKEALPRFNNPPEVMVLEIE